MDTEKEIVSYVYEYGNTKEGDIINYGMRNLNCSSKRMKKVIERMIEKGKIHRVVHSKLRPPAVYVGLKEHFPPEIEKEIAEADAQKILEEAATIAEQKIKERYGKN